MASLISRAAILAIAVAFTCVFFINFCDLVYGCGCTWLWAGAADHCNIHTGPKHCPWCAIGEAGQFIVWLSIVIPQAVVSFWPSAWGWHLRLALALCAFPAFGSIAALVVGLWKGYWG
jgi:hypothetical protein